MNEKINVLVVGAGAQGAPFVAILSSPYPGVERITLPPSTSTTPSVVNPAHSRATRAIAVGSLCGRSRRAPTDGGKNETG